MSRGRERQEENLRLQRCLGQSFHGLAGQGKDLQTVHHVRFHTRDPNELQVLLLSDLSHCGVCFPLESFTIIVGNWETLALGPEAIWCMVLIHYLYPTVLGLGYRKTRGSFVQDIYRVPVMCKALGDMVVNRVTQVPRFIALYSPKWIRQPSDTFLILGLCSPYIILFGFSRMGRRSELIPIYRVGITVQKIK